ncbi:MAG: PRC-barrel domain-containing protein [Phycisphaerales bacterium]
MKHRMILVATLAAAGSLAWAQDKHQDKNGQDQKRQDQTKPHDRRGQDTKSDTRAPMFLSCDRVRGMDVKNSAGDSVGTIKDLILDRGSGEIAYIVLKSGTVLGMGGKDTVVPFDAFGWTYDGKNASMEVVPDQVKNWPEFDLDAWSKSNRSEDSLPRVLASRYYHGDAPQTSNVDGRSPERIHGKITKISRRSGDNVPEEVVITVNDGGRSRQEVVLGPSWYLSGNNVVLYRDADVDIDTIRVTRGGEQYTYASNITMDDRRVPLYSGTGWPSWSARAQGTPQDYVDTPFVLSTEIDGKSVVARGEKSGEVEDIILDANGRRIAFLAVDPSALDDRHLVPWNIVSTVGKDMIMLDASKEMISLSAKAPSDLSTLYASDAYKAIYRTYDIPEPNDTNRHNR